MSWYEIFYVSNIVMAAYSVRLFFVMLMFRRITEREGYDALQHHYGILIAVLMFWVWFNPKGLRKLSHRRFMFERL